MPSIEFFVSSNGARPSPAGSKTFKGRSKKTGKAIIVDSAIGSYEWKRTIKQEAFRVMKECGYKVEDFNKPLTSHMVFHMPIPKSLAKKVSEGDPHIKMPDITKLTRAAEDAMSKTVYPDDNLIWDEGLKRKIYSKTPGVWIRIETN